MAEQPKQGLDPKEKQWVKQGLTVLKATLIRRRGTETPGSPIHQLRGTEIQEIDTLIQKFA